MDMYVLGLAKCYVFKNDDEQRLEAVSPEVLVSIGVIPWAVRLSVQDCMGQSP